MNLKKFFGLQRPADPAMAGTMEDDTLPAMMLNMDRINLEVLKFYTEEEAIPKRIKERLWALGLKGLSNGFLEPKDNMLIDGFYHIMRIDFVESLPSYLLDYQDVADLDQAYLTMTVAAKRAIGLKGEVVNERTMQNTQIVQRLSQSAQKSYKTGGMLSKIFG